MGRKLIIGAAAVAVLAVGGYVAAERVAETKVRERIDAELATMGAAEQVTYGKVAVDLFGKGATVSDVVYHEAGVPVWRIDRVALTDYAADAEGRPMRFAAAVTGVHLDFPGWAKSCREQRIACDYVSDDLGDEPEALIADAAVDYRIDDAAKRIAFGSAVTLHGLIEIKAGGTVGGLDMPMLASAAQTVADATRAGLPAPMAAMVAISGLGRAAERVELSNVVVAMRDLGGLRRQAEHAARDGDARPVDEIAAAQLAEAQADLRANADAWVPPEFVEAMAAALKPFALEGKPYRIAVAEGAPVALLVKGANGLELAPGIVDPRSLFAALKPSVSNAPL